MLPEERRAAFVVDDPAADDEACRCEEAGASSAVEQQKDTCREENAEGQQAEDGGDEPRPAGQRHAQQRHALGAQIDQCGDEVQRAHQRRGAEDRDAHDPEGHPCALSGTSDLAEAAERRIGGPATDGSAFRYEERGDEDDERDKRRPEGEHVQRREGHILGADLNRQEVVSEAGLRRGGEHHKDHDGAVHGEQRQILFRQNGAARHEGKLEVGPGQVDTHEEGKRHAHEDAEEREQNVLNSDDLMIFAKDVFPDEPRRRLVVMPCPAIVRHHAVFPSCYCALAAAWSASHLSKSACERTFMTVCIW